MSELTRMLTNLTMAYGLMSKDQFVDAITGYAESRDMNEEKIKELIEQVFDELELTNKRRKANQAFEAVEKQRMANEGFEFAGSRVNTGNRTNSNSDVNSAILQELGALRKAVENLTSVMGNKNSSEHQE